MKPIDYAVASTIPGALHAMDRHFAPKAGGLDVVDLLKADIEPTPDKFVSITRIPELHGITETDDVLQLGAAVTLQELVDHPTVKSDFAALSQCLADAATPQVRAVGTLAGNLCQMPRCWYYRGAHHQCLLRGGEFCSAQNGENTYHSVFQLGPCVAVSPSNLAHGLVALDAEVVIVSESGRRTVSCEDFMKPAGVRGPRPVRLSDGELIVAIRLPKRPAKSAYIDFKEKQTYDWPLAAAAVAHWGDKWSVVLGAVAPTPWRAEAAERLLGDAAGITPDLAERAADAALTDAGPLAQNAWRLKLVRAAVRRALLKADGKEFV